MLRAFLTFLFIVSLSVASLAQTKAKELFAAIHDNDARKVEQLLNEGADASAIMQMGPGAQFSALTMAINTSTFPIVKLLVEHKAQLEWKDWFKTTALMYAAGKGSPELVELLLAHGADVRADDGQGTTVLGAAQQSKNRKVIALIEAKLKE
ncbi:ankyrin repeat protein [Hymenobacter luteus]|uniref:Ankyrin repeat protein n=2 Tax=Hymenobacter TaxID=89966 RepID=A0A7W9WCF5_9BACT|nr:MULTISPECIES: ankyrin repeat domain-containing protein [Hymenobacter]MBB4601564.1 ankyrin repeat protein [Hymenobacter latericoloratus]MBB6060008.1 ankyrin repeat protein [Hymenobacter luteus]